MQQQQQQEQHKKRASLCLSTFFTCDEQVAWDEMGNSKWNSFVWAMEKFYLYALYLIKFYSLKINLVNLNILCEFLDFISHVLKIFLSLKVSQYFPQGHNSYFPIFSYICRNYSNVFLSHITFLHQFKSRTSKLNCTRMRIKPVLFYVDWFFLYFIIYLH